MKVKRIHQPQSHTTRHVKQKENDTKWKNESTQRNEKAQKW